MTVFRCIISGLLFLGGLGFLRNGMSAECLLVWLVAASVIPYYAVNIIVCGLGLLCGIAGLLAFFSSVYVNAFLGVIIAVIIFIKRRRRQEEREYCGYGGSYGGGYSGGYSSSDESASARDNYYREEEERRRRQRDEEFEEERRRRQEAFEAESRRREAENLSQRKYGCDANTASQWDKDIRNRL